MLLLNSIIILLQSILVILDVPYHLKVCVVGYFVCSGISLVSRNNLRVFRCH